MLAHRFSDLLTFKPSYPPMDGALHPGIVNSLAAVPAPYPNHPLPETHIIDYYPRFGFIPASRLGIRCECDGVPDEAFMILVLKDEALGGVSGVARYRPEFADVTRNRGLIPSCSACNQTLSKHIRSHLS